MPGLSVFLFLLVNSLLVDALNIRRQAATVTSSVEASTTLADPAKVLINDIEVLNDTLNDLPEDAINFFVDYESRVRALESIFSEYLSAVSAGNPPPSLPPPPTIAVPTVTTEVVVTPPLPPITTSFPTPLPSGQVSILPINVTGNATVLPFPIPTLTPFPLPTGIISTGNGTVNTTFSSLVPPVYLPTGISTSNGTVNTTLSSLVPPVYLPTGISTGNGTVNTTFSSLVPPFPIPTANVTADNTTSPVLPPYSLPTFNVTINTTLPALPPFPIPTANGTGNNTLSIHMPIPVTVVSGWNVSTSLLTSVSTGLLVTNGTTKTFTTTESIATPVIVTLNTTSTYLFPPSNVSSIAAPPYANASTSEAPSASAATNGSQIFALPLVTPVSTTSTAGNGSVATLVSTKALGDVLVTANLSTVVTPVITSAVTTTSRASNGSAVIFVKTTTYTKGKVLVTANVSTFAPSAPATTVETITSTALNGSVATYTSTYTASEVIVTGNVSTYAMVTGGTFTTTQLLTSTVWVLPPATPTPTASASRIGTVVPTGYARFDARARSNIAAYYQPRGSSSTEELDNLCKDPSVNIINIPLVSRFQGPNAYPEIEQFPGCGAANSEQQKIAPGLKDCADLAESVKTCQALGKKILVSVGNNTTGEKAKTFSSADEARNFATTLWKLFGGRGSEEAAQPSALRPLGADVAVDGFGIEDNLNSPYYDELASTLRSHFGQDAEKTYYVSSAQGCHVPSPSASGVLRHMDFIYIRTQDAARGGCASDLGNLVSEWNTALLPQPPLIGDATPEEQGARLFIGGVARTKDGKVEALGGSKRRAVLDNSEFVRNVAKLYDSEHTASNLGGAAFWPGGKDLSEGNWDGTRRFLEQVKDAVSPKDVQ